MSSYVDYDEGQGEPEEENREEEKSVTELFDESVTEMTSGDLDEED